MLKKMLMTGLACLMTLPVYAAEQGLSTRDKSCSFYYSTQKNTKGWYIEVSPEMCKNGLVTGQGEVTIYNAFSKPAEQIYGFFNAGFWTGDKPLSAPVLGQTTETDGTQKVFFSIPNETSMPAQLIGQMVSVKQKDANYTPFSFCAPFRVLVKTADVTLFQNQGQTSKLIDAIVHRVRSFCPAEEQIMLYASMLDRPTPSDIFFYAIVDLKTARIDVKKNASFDVNLSMIEPPLDGINQEIPTLDVPDLPDDLSDLGIANQGEAAVMPGDETIVPVSKEDFSILLPQEIPAMLDKVPHLLLASDVLKKPVLGAAIVHIKSVQGNIAEADEPTSLKLTGDGLAIGWGVVSGTFANSVGTRVKGTVQVSTFVPCLQERCQELEGKNE